MKLMSLMLTLLAALMQGDADQLYYRAFYLESAVRQMPEAAEKYGEAAVAARKAGAAELELKALLGQARCVKSLGRLDESRTLFEQALQLDPECEEARAALAEQHPGDGLDPELAARIRALVEDLGGPGREIASEDLKRVGRLAVPFLEDALRRRQAAVVEQAAWLLAEIGGDQAIASLRLGLSDDEVLFHRLVAKALRNLIPDTQTEPLFRAAITHPDVETRRIAVAGLHGSHRFWSTELMVSLCSIALEDQDPEVRAHILASSVDWSRFVQHLRMFLSSELSSERLAAAKQISASPEISQRLSADLLLLQRDTDSEVRLAAARAMMNFEPEAANEAGARLLSDGDERVLETGVKILVKSKAPWTIQVRDAVRTHIQDGLRNPAADRKTFQQVRELLAAKSEIGFRGEDLVTLYGYTRQGWPADWVSDVREMIANRLDRRAQENPSQGWQWIGTAFRETADLEGQMQLLISATRSMDGRSPPAEGALSLFILAAHSEFPEVRVAAYGWLSVQSTRTVIDSLPHLLADLAGEDLKVAAEAFNLIYPHPRKEAARPALALLGRVQADPHAVSALPRAQARLVMSGIICRADRVLDFYARSAGAEAAPELRQILMEGDSELQGVAISGLARAVGTEALPDLLALADSSGDAAWIAKRIPNGELLTSFVQELPVERIDADLLKGVEERIPGPALERLLMAALDSEDQETVIQACKLADLAAFDSLLPKLTALLESDAYKVWNWASAAVEAIQKRKYQRTTAALFGPAGRSAAIERAMRLLKSKDPVDRQGGALALGALGDVAAVPALMDLLEDSDLSVRKAAVKALENLGSGKETPQGSK